MAESDSSDSNSLTSSGSAFDDAVNAKGKNTPEKKKQTRTESVNSSPGRVRLNEMEDEEDEVVIVDDGTYPNHIVKNDDSPLTPSSEDRRKSRVFHQIVKEVKEGSDVELNRRTVRERLNDAIQQDMENAKSKASINNKQKREVQRRI